MRSLALLAVLLAPQQADFESFKGKKPPELEIPAANWINAEKAVTLESLQGRVVWLEFVGSVS